MRQLQGRAADWWNSITIDTPEEGITWEQFHVRFEAKFISTAQKSVLFKKFVELKQGGRSVLEYVSEFEALSKYARSYIDSPYQKNEKFVTGLDAHLGRQLVDHLDDPFEKLVEKALRHESLFPRESSVVAVTKEESKPQ